MLFNVDICESLYLDGRKNSSATVMLDGNENPIVNCIKDLGIYVQSSTSWKGHIQAKLVAARKSFQFLKRTIPHNVSVATKLLFYRLCVHSILLYGSQIWYPQLVKGDNQNFSTEIVFIGSPVSGTTIFNSREHILCPCLFILHFKT